ncbi:MAG TPA: PAS domain-containing sensor histidine kinase [Burkholderiales bacterium]|nr:PAS domain-containing sensor histidine kinase [Burkholderiales bacterium]
MPATEIGSGSGNSPAVERRARDDFKRSLFQVDSILESMLVGITLAVDGHLTWLNETFARMLGYDRDELTGRPTSVLYPDGESFEVFGAAGYPLLRSGRSHVSEQRLKRKDGSLIWVQCSGTAVDAKSPAHGTVWTSVDITERKELQESLQRSLAERDVILQSTLVGIAFSVNRRHLWVNETFASMMGFAREELIGQLSVVHFPDLESYEAFGNTAYRILASGRPCVTERWQRRKDGTLIWCQIYGNYVDPDDLSKGTIWTFQDITERKHAEEDVKRALEKERELNELKSRFVAMTSHEFRTPLATILSSAELLEQYTDRLPPEEKEDLYRSIRGSVERMTRMLDNVLTIGEAEASMLQFSPAPADLAAFCTQLAGEMRRSAGGRHTIEFLYEGVRGPVRVDEKLLRHALSNLLSNAIKYSPDGGRIELRVAVDAKEARFEVRDEGIGIPPEDQTRLFETFHRARNVGTIAGTGLGLAIVKKSLELHGGSVTVESVPGLGTTFRMTVPLG